MLGVSLWEAPCGEAAQTEAERNGDGAFKSIRKAIREIPSSEGKAKPRRWIRVVSTRAFLSICLQILQIIHTVEECPDTLAFATEPVLASLANILAFYVSQ